MFWDTKTEPLLLFRRVMWDWWCGVPQGVLRALAKWKIGYLS